MRKISEKGTRTNKCSKCKNEVEESRKNQRYCKSCHNEHMRKTRPKHSELSELAKKKANARAYAKVYLNRGIIKKQGCVVCGNKAQMHHEDYNKPIDVIWYCRKHHLELHLNG